MKKVAKNLKNSQRSGSFVRDGIVCKKKTSAEKLIATT